MLSIGENILFPLDAITQTFAVIAKRRVGNTYTASRMAEEMAKAVAYGSQSKPIGATKLMFPDGLK
jgi:hypothetical protein